MKRSFDLVCSVAALLLLFSVLVLIGILIKVDSRGPLFFTQTRVGACRRNFKIYKFRSMYHRNADEIDQITEGVFTAGVDARITRIGRFLRAASLDELPQLLNIINGDMSIVGPRPILPEQLEVVPQEYLARFDVRPGLTGLAQVRGRRRLGWISQLQFDVEYVRRRSMLFDARIIARTVLVVLKQEDIYGGVGKNWREYREELQHKARASTTSSTDA